MPVVFEALPSSTTNPLTPHSEDTLKSSSPSKKPTKTREKINILGAYMTNPTGVYFATQGKGEHIILFLRQHPITQIGWVLLVIFLAVCTPYLFPLLTVFFPPDLVFPDSYKLVFYLFWYLILFGFTYVEFILWYYNVNIVTNKRIVDIDFYYLLVQEVTATRITQVEDVTYRRIGLASTVFNYGNVFVQTAGSEANIEFLRVPQPKKAVQTIIRLMGTT